MRLARDHAHLLRVAMQTFSRQSSTVLTTSLRVVSTVGTPVIEEFSYDEYLTGLPDQAPLSASRLFVEGWTEQIGTDDWSMTFNTSPLDVVVWKLEDPLYGAIDAMNRIAY